MIITDHKHPAQEPAAAAPQAETPAESESKPRTPTTASDATVLFMIVAATAYASGGDAYVVFSQAVGVFLLFVGLSVACKVLGWLFYPRESQPTVNLCTTCIFLLGIILALVAAFSAVV